MSESTVHKASHCAWQIHYHIVFPVKYRKALLAEDVVEIIVEATRGIAERYDMEFERLGCDRDHIHLLWFCSSEDCSGTNRASVQEYHRARVIPAETSLEDRVVGRAVLG